MSRAPPPPPPAHPPPPPTPDSHTQHAPPPAPPPHAHQPRDPLTYSAAIRAARATTFPTSPPHTIQRLAELVLEPKKRYRYLSPYLRALDRVVAVSSPLTVFPLPLAVLPSASGLLNGTPAANPATSALGSDESLGGALLTPIPWLQSRAQNELISESTEMVDGPNGAGRIETVTVGMLAGLRSEAPPAPVAQIASSHPEGETLPATGPVTQGELLRQEQQAGIVLNNPHSMTANPTRSAHTEPDTGATVVDTVEADDEAPHARGPEEIGMEDTGPQKQNASLDIEGAIGRPSLGGRSPGPEGAGSASKDEAAAEGKEADKGDEGGNNADKPEGGESEDVEMKSAD